MESECLQTSVKILTQKNIIKEEIKIVIAIDIKTPRLDTEQLNSLNKMWKLSVKDILDSTTIAASGHPGGAMSSIHFLLTLYAMANINPDNIHDEDRDRIIISHGHISPAVYASLARNGFFKGEDMSIHFRRMGSRYSGHVESGVPGVEWNTGNLGQGISTAVGMALAASVKGLKYKTIVCMGDGEQQKGQITEARRTAIKYKLSNLIAIIDYNQYQIGGHISDIMPQNIIDNYKSDGWNVIIVENGHDFNQVFEGLKKAWNKDVKDTDAPTLVVMKTVMGYGVSFMQNGSEYHGKPCTKELHAKALKELGLDNNLEELMGRKKALPQNSQQAEPFHPPSININTGESIEYDKSVFTDNRSAYGKALADLGKLNNFDNHTKIAAISCDLEGSVKMSDFRKVDPSHFFECGIQEHNATSMAGSLSKEGFQVFFSTFGIFGVDEVFNQQRLNAFNNTNVKTVCTHLGLSVGEDGPTHQCIDYIGLLKNIPGYKIFIPADPNQTDHIIRYISGIFGNCFVGMGRAKTPVITDNNDTPLFGKNYKFIPGKADIVIEGTDATIIAIGPMLEFAIKAATELHLENNISVQVINMASIVPFDSSVIIKAAKETKALLTIADHILGSGIDSMVDQVLIKNKISTSVKHLGVKGFVSSGVPEDLYKSQGMDVSSIKENLKEML